MSANLKTAPLYQVMLRVLLEEGGEASTADFIKGAFLAGLTTSTDIILAELGELRRVRGLVEMRGLRWAATVAGLQEARRIWPEIAARRTSHDRR